MKFIVWVHITVFLLQIVIHYRISYIYNDTKKVLDVLQVVNAKLGTIQIQTSGIYQPYNIERKLVTLEKMNKK